MARSQSSRLAKVFMDAKAEGRAAFVGYLPAGFPTLSESIELVETLAQHADLIEVGIPFTDPMMDGPTIQAAAQAALEGGVRTTDVLRTVEAVAATGTPVVVLLRHGRALALHGAVRDAQAILATWFLGTATGPAIASPRAAPSATAWPWARRNWSGRAARPWAARSNGRPGRPRRT